MSRPTFARSVSADDALLRHQATARRRGSKRLSCAALHDVIPENDVIRTESPASSESESKNLEKCSTSSIVVNLDQKEKSPFGGSPKNRGAKGVRLIRRGSLDFVPGATSVPHKFSNFSRENEENSGREMAMQRSSSVDCLLDFGLMLLESGLSGKDAAASSNNSRPNSKASLAPSSGCSSPDKPSAVKCITDTLSRLRIPINAGELKTSDDVTMEFPRDNGSPAGDANDQRASLTLPLDASSTDYDVTTQDDVIMRDICGSCSATVRDLIASHDRLLVETKYLRRELECARSLLRHNDDDKTDRNNQVPDPKSETRRLIDNIDDITDEEVLDKLLDAAEEYEDRKKIRAAMRELRRKYREALIGRPQDKNTNWKTCKTTTTVAAGVKGSNTGKYTSVTKTTTTTETRTSKPNSGLSRNTGSPLGGIKPMEMTPQVAKTLAEKYSISPSLLRKDNKMNSTGSKKIGSIFDREEETPKKSGSKLELERRQAERRRDLTRNRSMPASSSKDARKMFVAKLEGGSNGTTKKVGRSPTFVVPNANNVKQMLLKWCQVKTRGYENVEINNFSGSWANGLSFCALIHNFFPDSFDYSTLDPANREFNFELAFSTAERLADADQLLEVGDMILMGNRPDSKCVFTYVQSLYNKLRKFEKPLKPLTPTKPVVKVMADIVEVSSNSALPPSSGQ